jgi:hypothetical protein
MPSSSKPFWKSKVLWFNILVAALAAGEASLHFIQPNIPMNVYGIIAVVLAVGNSILRVISTATLTKGIK